MSLTDRVIEFAGLLRDHDFVVGTGQVEDALQAMTVIDLADRREFYLSLRAVLLSDRSQRGLFDGLFEAFWNWREPPVESVAGERVMEESSSGRRPAGDPRGAYSAQEGLYQKDFSDFTADEMGAVASTCAALARRLATRKSRRMQVTRRGHRVDRRGSLRRSLKYGGIPLELSRLRPKIRKPRLVVICDVSRSMEPYSVFLLHFIYSMQHLAGRVESFVFATSLHRVTAYFHRADILSALDDIAHEIPDWGGGTRIGQSLRTFNEEYAWRLVDHRTSVIILSDGLDTGQIDLLAEQMADLRSRAARIVWLNPVLEARAHQPLARGMAAALPHVDLLASAHNVASLQEAARAVVRGRERDSGLVAHING